MILYLLEDNNNNSKVIEADEHLHIQTYTSWWSIQTYIYVYWTSKWIEEKKPQTHKKSFKIKSIKCVLIFMIYGWKLIHCRNGKRGNANWMKVIFFFSFYWLCRFVFGCVFFLLRILFILCLIMCFSCVDVRYIFMRLHDFSFPNFTIY